MIDNLVNRYKSFFLSSNNLFKNAYYLLTTGLLSSIAGYLFWIVAAGYYSVEIIAQVGVLMSITGFLIALGDMGYGIAAIRFLPALNNKKSKHFIFMVLLMNFALTSLWYFLSIALFDFFGRYEFLFNGQVLLVLYLFVTMQGLLYAWGSCFTGLRRNELSLYQEVIVHFGKLLFLVLIAQYALTLDSLILGGALAMILANTFAFVRLIYLQIEGPNESELTLFDRHVMVYAAKNFFGRFALDSHQYIVPILAYAVLDPGDAGIFYICWICGLAFRIVPSACLNSLFAKLSEVNPAMKKLVWNALILNFTILFSGMLFLIVFGQYVLGLFGEIYQEYNSLVVVIGLAAVPWTINYFVVTLCRVRNSSGSINLIGLSLLITTSLLVPYFGGLFGMYGIAVAYLAAQIVALFLVLTFLKLTKSRLLHFSE